MKLLYVPALIFSWTGWTKDDWIDQLRRLNPLNFIFGFGWSKEDWINILKTSFGWFVFLLVIFTAVLLWRG